MEDRSAAVDAFHRLYQFAKEEGDYALATFAVYKALQKLEEEALEPIVSGAPPSAPGDAVPLPDWVRSGLWTTLESYIINPKLPGRTPKQRTKTFLASLKSTWLQYSRWFAIYSARLQSTKSVTKAAEELDGGVGEGKTGSRSYRWLEAQLSEANQRPYKDGCGRVLANVEPRDLIPTGHLLKIFQRLSG